jgi:hypothetical protein
MDRGAPISYLVLAEGTPVVTRDGHEVGTVKRVLAVEEKDIFDGIVIDTAEGERFAEAESVGSLYEHQAVLALDAAAAAHLPEPRANPPAVTAEPDDVESDTGEQVKDAARRTWDRLSGNY